MVICLKGYCSQTKIYMSIYKYIHVFAFAIQTMCISYIYLVILNYSRVHTTWNLSIVFCCHHLYIILLFGAFVVSFSALLIFWLTLNFPAESFPSWFTNVMHSVNVFKNNLIIYDYYYHNCCFQRSRTNHPSQHLNGKIRSHQKQKTKLSSLAQWSCSELHTLRDIDPLHMPDCFHQGP